MFSQIYGLFGALFRSSELADHTCETLYVYSFVRAYKFVNVERFSIYNCLVDTGCTTYVNMIHFFQF